MAAKIIQTNSAPFKTVALDSIALDIIENALRNARTEMDAVLFRTAMSPGIREQHDAFPATIYKLPANSFSSAGNNGPSFSATASRTVSTITCVLRSISMFSSAPKAFSPNVVMRKVSGMSQTSNQPSCRFASATVRLAPLMAI